MKTSRVAAIAGRVLRQLRHDKRVLVFMFGVPSLAMILFGFSFSGNIRDVRVAVIDEDQTEFSAAVIDNLLANDTLSVSQLEVPKLSSEELLVKSGYQAAIRFPADFGSAYFARLSGSTPSSQAKVYLTIDESDPQISAAVQASLVDALMNVGPGAPVKVETQNLYQIDVRFIDSFAPAIMGLVCAFVCTMLTLMSVVREKVDGTFSRIWVSPVRRGEFILGYVVAFGLIALVQATLVLTIGKLVFSIVINGSLLWAYLCVMLFAIGSVGLGTLMSALANTESQAILFFPLVMLPSVLLSGMLWPLQAIPKLLRPIAYIVPLTYSNRLLRAVMVKGLSPWQEPIGFAGVLAFVVITIILASSVLHQSSK